MLRVLVLVGAFFFFRSVLPRNSRNSPTAISPYMNSLDGAMSAQEVSSVLDEVMPYESWLASRLVKGDERGSLDRPLTPFLDEQELTISGSGGGHDEV